MKCLEISMLDSNKPPGLLLKSRTYPATFFVSKSLIASLVSFDAFALNCLILT